MAAPIPSGSITNQRLGIGYDRSEHATNAIMSCQCVNSPPETSMMVTLLAPIGHRLSYLRLCNLLFIRRLALFSRILLGAWTERNSHQNPMSDGWKESYGTKMGLLRDGRPKQAENGTRI